MFPLTVCVALIVAADPTPAEGDPAATKLLADAAANRATWEKFPGFTAAIEINRNGTINRGFISVSANAEVTLTGLPTEVATWADELLTFICRQRMPGASAGPSVFLDIDTVHPQGRAIRPVTSSLPTVYRVKDKQVTVVDRTASPGRFVLTVQRNDPNPDGKFLPLTYTVTYWDRTNTRLIKSEAYSHTWVRVGGYDLPASVAVSTAKDAALTAETVTLSEHKLLGEK